jgi:uncharacterized protein
VRPRGDVAVGPLDPDDLPAALVLNNAAVPHVNELDADRLAELVDLSSFAAAARAGGSLVGFALAMAPGVPYDSPNYRWFNERHDDLRYLDRIVVDPTARRSGVGRTLYDAVFEHAQVDGCPLVGCEVNLEPPNPGSQAFHRSLGFVEVGRQSTYGDTVEVQLLLAEVDEVR